MGGLFGGGSKPKTQSAQEVNAINAKAEADAKAKADAEAKAKSEADAKAKADEANRQKMGQSSTVLSRRSDEEEENKRKQGTVLGSV